MWRSSHHQQSKISPGQDDVEEFNIDDIVNDIEHDIHTVSEDINRHVSSVSMGSKSPISPSKLQINMRQQQQRGGGFPFPSLIPPSISNAFSSGSASIQGQRQGQGARNLDQRQQQQPNSFLDSAPTRFSMVDEDKGDRHNDNTNDNIIKLTHEKDGHEAAANKATMELKSQFETLTSQLAEFKSRYTKANEKLMEMELTKQSLEDKVDALEETLEEISRNGGGGGGGKLENFKIGSGGAKRKFRGGGGDDNDPLRKKVDIQFLLDDQSNEMDIAFDDLKDLNNLQLIFRQWIQRHLPFKNEIRAIEARFGSSVASFFIFYRFLFLQFLLISIISIVFSILHLMLMAAYKDSSTRFIINKAGLLPGFMIYSTFREEEGLKYSTMVIVGSMSFLFTVLEKIVREDKTSKEMEAVEKEVSCPYSKEALVAWDCSIASAAEASDHCGSLAQMFQQMLEETRTQGVKKSRTNKDLFFLYGRRTVGFLLYSGIQAGAFAVIIYASVRAADIQIFLAKTPAAKFSTFVSPLILNFVNGAIPPFIAMITKFEKWDSGAVEVNMLLFRLFASNLLNTLILTISYFLLADPVLLSQYPSTRSALELTMNNAYNCRIDFAADSLFTLVITAFISNNVSISLPPYLSMLYAQWGNKPFIKGEFEIASSMVTMLNFMGMILLSFPFAPLTMFLVPVYIAINIKFGSFVYLNLYSKPKKPWKAHKAGFIFTIYYCAVIILLGISTSVFFLTSRTFPKSCDIQDQDPQICASSVSPATETCTVDPNSIYYGTFKSTNYPADICNHACGPFINNYSNIGPFKKAILSALPSDIIWEALFDYPYLPWGLVIILATIMAQKQSTVDVSKQQFFLREKSLDAQIVTLEAEKKKLDKQLARMKMANTNSQLEDM